MSATATVASTILATPSTRPSRPYWALGALALMVGVFVMAGSWISLGPRAVPATYFTVTSVAGAQDAVQPCWGSLSCDFMASTRQDVVQQLGDTPYASITGPFSTFVRSDPGSQTADAILVGGLAALIAYLLLGLLGFSARFRRLEAPLGEAAAAFANRFGATKRARAWSLHLVVAGAIASGLVAWILVSALTAALTSMGWGFDTPPLWASTGAVVLFGVISIGVLAAFALVLRRVRISEGVGSFLLGYGSLLAGGWVLALVALGASCVSYPVISETGEVLPAACLGNAAVSLFSDGGVVLAVSLLTLFCALPAVGALLVYRDYQRRRAAPSGPQLTRAAA
jgi:hypothetical protein